LYKDLNSFANLSTLLESSEFFAKAQNFLTMIRIVAQISETILSSS